MGHADFLIPRISEEEYLRREELADTKSEFEDGYIVDMAGGSPEHSEIAQNLGGLIFVHLNNSGQNCRSFNSDLMVKIEETKSYYHPDLTVICGTPEFNQGNPRALLNPTLVVEILSPSTMERDLTEKMRRYKRLPSLKEILFINSVKPYISGVYKAQDFWIDGPEIEEPDEIYRIQTLGLDLRLSQVYGVLLDELKPGRTS